MKLILSLSFYFLFFAQVQAQTNVFVLVDVSKSVHVNQLADARQALMEVLTGSPITKAFVSQGIQSDLSGFKLISGDKLAVSKFGSLQTSNGINPSPTTVQNLSIDISQVLNLITWVPTDNQTYLTLAKAKIAEYTKRNRISKYKLIIISDNVEDDYGPGGLPKYPDSYTQNLAEGYNTSTNPVSEQGYTKLKFANNSLFTISLSPGVDVTKYNPPPQQPGGAANPPPPTPPDSPARPSITLITFADGKKDNPRKTNDNTFTLSWTCNCVAGTRFNVMLTELDGGAYKDQKRNFANNSLKFNDIPGGKYKIVVSATGASSAITFIETPGTSYAWLIILLILIIAGGIGYYLWNSKRGEKIERSASKPTDDIFKSSSPNNKSSSSNSDYF